MVRCMTGEDKESKNVYKNNVYCGNEGKRGV